MIRSDKNRSNVFVHFLSKLNGFGSLNGHLVKLISICWVSHVQKEDKRPSGGQGVDFLGAPLVAFPGSLTMPLLYPYS